MKLPRNTGLVSALSRNKKIGAPLYVKTKEGDVFEVTDPNDGTVVGHLVFLMRDPAQLESDVVAVFGPSVPEAQTPPLFVVHVFLKFGLRTGYWRKIKKHLALKNVQFPLFVSSWDYGYCPPGKEGKWRTWRIGEPEMELTHWTTATELGVVLSPENVYERLREGHYSYVYPAPAGPVGGWPWPTTSEALEAQKLRIAGAKVDLGLGPP
jgi:hypothetical protein